MSSFLQRTTQLNPENHYVSAVASAPDFFSEFNSFRNEAKRKVDTIGGNQRGQTSETSAFERIQFKGILESRFGQPLSSQKQQLQQQQSSLVSPTKKSTIQVQNHSPARSFLASSKSNTSSNTRELLLDSRPTNLNSLRKDIREIASENPISKHLNQLSSRLSILSPQRKTTQSDASPKKKDQRTTFQLDTNSSRARGASSSASNRDSCNIKQKLVSYSPSNHKQQQRVFSPSRLLGRISSSPNAQFGDLEDQTLSNRQEIIQSYILRPLSSQSSTVRRSSSVQAEGIQSLFDNSRSKIAVPRRPTLFTPSVTTSFASIVSNSSTLLNNSKSNVSQLGQNCQLNAQTFIVEKRTRDLQDSVSALTQADFNALPKENIENLIKLSSLIMSKVKNSMFYKNALY